MALEEIKSFLTPWLGIVSMQSISTYRLSAKTLQELRVLAKDASVRQAGSSCKADIVESTMKVAIQDTRI